MLLNGIKSDLLPVSMGILQGLILGPMLFVLFYERLTSYGFVYIYADDTTIYCVGETADLAINQLNKAY